ncbi:TniQ family protein [Trichlorobacter lovleyi]|uniref:TniQ family protein n=1 Tax=Trichlorobacter lovleyi TaxID=313985 RepID=UPI002240A8C1|nr:TniQ family protein [Trichlorobacter lovleyi]QOX77913.1 TniQ family protein [Trichlorobacter lovleyi]
MIAYECPEFGDGLYDFIPIGMTPPRKTTSLYSLEPIGVGTPFVESLASYLTRLAAAHMLPMSAMLRLVIGPCLPRDNHNFGKVIGRQGIVVNMNGIGQEALDMVDALEMLTGRSGLDRLTMLPFSNLLAKYKLQKQASFWCPYCLNEQRASGQLVHYPLFWSLKMASKCPIHRCYLQTRCPHCTSVQPVIGSRSVVGYCNSCKEWLGDGAKKKTWTTRVDENDFFLRLFEWHNTVGHKREQPTFPSVLEYLIGSHMKKHDAKSLARLLHLPDSIIEELLEERMLPALGVVFWIGQVFKVDPFDLLTKSGEEMAAKDVATVAKGNYSAFDQNRVDWKQLEGVLRDVASGKASAMRVEDIARVYRCPTSELIRRYPEYCCGI